MTTTTDISIHSHNFKSFLSAAAEAAAKDKKDQDLWTTEYLADQLFLHLASVKETITNDKGDTLTVRKYYRQAQDLMKWIPITRIFENLDFEYYHLSVARCLRVM